MKKLHFFLIAFYVIFSVAAQTPVVDSRQKDIKVSDVKVPVDPHVRIGKLANGITYYIRNNGKPENKVSLRLVVNAGSILEDENQRGLAHFMEHMNFNGTKHFKKNQLVDYLQSIGVEFGADLNAYTSFDETVYMLPIPSDDKEKLDKGFEILEDWAFNSLLTPEEIDKERGVVLEEYRLGLGAEKRMMNVYFPKLMYNSKYAERLPIGKKEILENFKPETLRKFKNDWYRPDLMAVIAIGDVDVDALETKIKSHFGKYPAAKNPRKRIEYDVPNHKETLVAIARDKEALFNQVRIMYKDYDKPHRIKTESDYRNYLLRRLFSQMINNRLDEIRNKPNPPFVFAFSGYTGVTRTKNAYTSSAMTAPDTQLKALKVLLEENERVKRYGFQPGEFERAKKDIMARLDKSLLNKDKNESDRYVNGYINHYLEESPIPGIEWEHRFTKTQLPTIKLEKVNNLINKFLHEDNRVVILTGADKKEVPEITEKQVLDLLSEVEKSDVKPYEDKELGDQLMTVLPKKGRIVSAVSDPDLGITELKLSNGATLIYKKTDFKDDEVLMRAFSYGGTSLLDDQTLAKTVYAWGGLPDAGINGYSLTDLSKLLSGKIVRVNPVVNNLSEGMRGSSTPKDLETMFQMIHLYFTKLNKDEKAFGSYINKQKAFLGTLLGNPGLKFQVEFNNFLHQNDKRYFGFPTPKILDQMDYDLAYSKYQERFADAGDFKFYFVGNFDEKELKNLAEQYIASLPGKGTHEKFVDHGFRPLTGKHKKIVKVGKDPKSSVNILFQGETVYDPKEAYLMKSLGEVLTIKLIEKLREEESGVYGVGASGNMSKLPYGSYRFNISFPCGPENVEKLKNSALAELKKIIDHGPEEKDVHKVIETQLIKYRENLKKNDYWLNELYRADFNRFNRSDIIGKEAEIKALKAADLQRVAKKYLSGDYIIGIQYPEDEAK